jgi:hypothetical protein
LDIWTSDTEIGGAAAFTDLTDTPASLGTAGQFVAVNSGATALEFVAAPEGTGGVGVDGGAFGSEFIAGVDGGSF